MRNTAIERAAEEVDAHRHLPFGLGTEGTGSGEPGADDDDRRRAAWWGPVSGGIVALLVLWLLGLASCTSPMEDDLRDRSEAALTAADLGGVSVDFDGRDATLSGSVDPDRAQDAFDVVRGLEGVRHVDTTFDLTGTSSASLNDSLAIGVAADGRSVTVRGEVGSEAERAAVLDAVSDRLGPDVEVVDQLLLVPGVTSIDLSDAASLTALEAAADLPPLNGAGAPVGDSTGYSISVSTGADGRRSVVVEGTVGSMVERIELIAAVRRATGLDVIDRLVVATGAGSSGSTPTTPTSPASPTTTPAAPATPTTLPEVVQEAQVDINAILSTRVVEFATGSAALTAQGSAVLDELAPVLAGAAPAKVQIAGNTDNTGNAAANQALSEARAVTVRDALIARGIASDRLSTVGYGGDRPVADNNTSAGRQRNRRIDFVLSV